MKARATMILAITILSIPALSQATMYKVRICVKYVVDYDDAWVGDYWTDNDNDKIAFGIYARIIRHSDGHYMFDNYMDEDTGCTPEMWLSSSQQFDIYAWSKALVNNNYIMVKNHSDGTVYLQQLGYDWSPDDDKSYYFHYLEGAPSEDESYLAAASSYALHEKPGVVTGETLTVINDQCPAGDWNCNGSDGNVYISDQGRDNKYTIGHEIGH